MNAIQFYTNQTLFWRSTIEVATYELYNSSATFRAIWSVDTVSGQNKQKKNHV